MDYRNTPNPTEYRGHRFASKSEAIFARVLDRANYPYKPQVECNGHTWDFLVWRYINSQPFVIATRPQNTNVARRSWRPAYIEFKPSEPTDTYIEQKRQLGIELRRNAAQYLLENESDCVVPDVFIVYGSVYEGLRSDQEWFEPNHHTTSYFLIDCGRSFGRPQFERMFQITEQAIQEAKEFRFDLRS